MKNVKNQGPFNTVHNESTINILTLLKACAARKDLRKGSELHAYIREHTFLHTNFHVASSLVNMYAKCGALAQAQQVFNKLPVRDTVTWNTLIAGYAQNAQAEEALKCFDNMQREGHCPNAVTFTCALKACGSIGAVIKGEQIHDKIISLRVLDSDIILGSTLVDMYAKCGAISKAEKVLKEFSLRNVITWNALLAGCVQHGQEEEALECFDCMQQEGHFPNAVTFTCVLKACASLGIIGRGEQIHKAIVSLDILEEDIVLGSALLDMYVKCGALFKAKQVLEELPVRDIVKFTALIGGYVGQGQGEEALMCFDILQQEGHSPNTVTFTCALKACTSIRAVAKGEEIHNRVVILGMMEDNAELASALVDMYVKCGALTKAQQVLEELPARDVVTWTVLIAGYAQQGQGEEALKCFDGMQCEGHSPDPITFTCVLKACGGIGAAAKGEKIHGKIVNLGLLEKDVVLGCVLIDMYARCGALTKAQKALEDLPVRNVVMWNALITGYVEQGQGEEALKCFDSMLREGHPPDTVSFLSALKACGNIQAVAKGKQIHDMVANLNILEKDIALGSSLVDMYAQCGALAKAQQVLKKLPVRNVVTWNALIARYVQQGQGEEALECIDTMLSEDNSPDAVTFTCALKACGSIGAVARGENIHDEIVGLGMLENNMELGSTLVDMYAKCAALAKAEQILEELAVQNVVAWTALLAGYAQKGQSTEALSCFQRMQTKGMKPNSTTLLCMLYAFSHSGLTDQAEMIFSRMRSENGIAPDVEHCCCMIDLFGRSGRFYKALSVIEKMPCAEYLPVWVALLGACRKWGDVKIGRFAFECILHLDNSDASVYICMISIYTAAGMQEDADRIEMMIHANNVKGAWVMLVD